MFLKLELKSLLKKESNKMKETKVIYTLKKVNNTYKVSKNVQDVSDEDTEEVLSLILADIISVFKENEAPKSLTKEMMNKVIDTVYEMHPTHLEE